MKLNNNNLIHKNTCLELTIQDITIHCYISQELTLDLPTDKFNITEWAVFL